MRKNLIFLILAAGVLLLIGAYFLMRQSAPIQSPATEETASNETSSGCSETVGTQTVEMLEDSFQPDSITIKKCTAVIFENRDSKGHWPASNIHPTHGIYPEFDPQKAVSPGESWSFTFDKVGTWRYHDHLFPSVRGEIVVNE